MPNGPLLPNLFGVLGHRVLASTLALLSLHFSWFWLSSSIFSIPISLVAPIRLSSFHIPINCQCLLGFLFSSTIKEFCILTASSLASLLRTLIETKAWSFPFFLEAFESSIMTRVEKQLCLCSAANKQMLGTLTHILVKISCCCSPLAFGVKTVN